MLIDLTSLLTPISADEPSGPNLEYDADFTELERRVQTTPGEEYGNFKVPEREPEWPDVKDKALALLTRTKDLRVAVHLTAALVHCFGFAGLAEGLALVRGLLEQFWESVHPQLDREDNNDPAFRLNTLRFLFDAGQLALDVERIPLVVSRAHGSFALRHIDLAAGKAKAEPNVEPPSASMIEAAFLDGDLSDLQAAADATANAIEETCAIETALEAKISLPVSVDVSPLKQILQAANKVLQEWLERRGAVPSASMSGDGSLDTARQPGDFLKGGISSREDILRILDGVCDYLNHHEPTNPAPIFIDCAKKLMSKNFIEISHELGVEGVALLEKIRGSETVSNEGV